VQSAFNDSSNTDNIKICRYSEHAICKVRIRERMSTIVKLPIYDKIKTHILGDNTNFSFDILDDSRNKAVIRGIYPGADTSLSIIGESGFIYVFYIRIDSTNSKFVPDLLVNLKLNKKDSATVIAMEKANRKLQELQQNNKSLDPIIKQELDYLDKKHLINASQLNFGFKQINGDKALMPKKIFDDGIWTYFKYGEDNLIDKSKLPVIYAVRDGYDMPINSRIENGYLILETVSDKWTLRSGESYACVQRGGV
jgi:type IV secretory pathway VirB9-like protein